MVKFSPVLFIGLGIAGYLMLLHHCLWWLGRPGERADGRGRRDRRTDAVIEP